MAPIPSVRIIVLLAAAIASAMLTLRACLGSFDYRFLHIDSPFTAESVFSLCVIFLWFARGRGPAGGGVEPAGGGVGPAGDGVEKDARPSLTQLAIVLCIVGGVFSLNLHDPFLSDDYVMLSRPAPTLHSVALRFSDASGDGSFRPIGNIYFDLVNTWAHWNPWLWHLCGLSLHLLACALLYFLAWTLWRSRWIALSSALLFGLHGSRPEVVTWTAGNFDSLAACFVIAGLLCIFRKPTFGKPTFGKQTSGWLVLANLCTVLAVLCKESAYAMPAFVLGLAIATRRQGERGVRRGFVSAVLLCAGLFVYRWILFQGPGGYLDPATKRPAILSVKLVPAVKALSVRLWSVLLFPLDWQSRRTWLLAVAVVLTCATVLLAAFTIKVYERRVVGGLLLTTALAILPAIHLALVGESMSGARILYLPSIGFCMALAWVLSSRTFALVLMVAALALGLVHNLGVWHEAALTADRTCAIAAASDAPEKTPMPNTLRGVFSFGNGLSQCVELKRRMAAAR